MRSYYKSGEEEGDKGKEGKLFGTSRQAYTFYEWGVAGRA